VGYGFTGKLINFNNISTPKDIIGGASLKNLLVADVMAP
jgi:hypothetical protein